MSLLEVQNLRVHFPVRGGVLARARGMVKAVDGVSFSIAPGETVGLVGESGCGKTTVARALVRLIPVTEGRILYEGRDVTALNGAALRAWRRQVQMVFQDPYSSLDPRMTVAQTIGEAFDLHGLARNGTERRNRVEKLLLDVGLDGSHADRYPHELSGGQRQRVGIARALAVEPKLLVCDEPVSALDVSIQAQIVNLLQDLQQRHGLAYLFIAHDLAVVEHLSRRILVMYLGRLVEAGDAREVCRQPRHPYTQALLSAVPVVDPDHKRARLILPGDLPSPIAPPPGCPFHPRCPVAETRCRLEMPALRELSPGHFAACHFPIPEAAEVRAPNA
jgi:oligopeptide/dipeptide ABC transporter ATP-binding protein